MLRLLAALALVALLTVAFVTAAVARPTGTIGQAHAATKILVYVATQKGGPASPARLELVNRQGRTLRVLSRASYGTWANWSPDDAEIAWEDPTGIHVEAADGSDPRLLVAAPPTSCRQCRQLSFIWSPDSRSLIVGSAGPTSNQMQQVPLDGSAPTVLLGSTNRTFVYSPGMWTPDGNRLVYSVSRETPYPTSELRVLNVATGKTDLLETTRAQEPGLTISPSLRYWVHIRQYDNGKRQQLRIKDKATGKTHIVKGVNATNLIGWSPDSSTLAVVDATRQLVTVAPTGVVEHRIGPCEDFFWGRRGELFIIRDKAYTQVWDSLNGGPERSLFHAPKNFWVVSLDGN